MTVRSTVPATTSTTATTSPPNPVVPNAVATPTSEQLDAALAAVEPGFPAVLLDQISVLVAPGATDDDAFMLAEAVGGRPIGKFAVGSEGGSVVYQLRFEQPIDFPAVSRQLEAREDVEAVAQVILTVAQATAAEYPDYAGADASKWWHHEQTKALDAWASYSGVGQVVGVVDGPVDITHHELAGSTRVPALYDDNHGTHVAGLACARLDGSGSVGTAPGCTVSGYAAFTSDHMADGMASLARAGARTVNISMGSPRDGKCGARSVAPSPDDLAFVANNRGTSLWFRNVARAFPNTLFVFSAGNGCNNSADDPIKLGVGGEPNVLLVASSNASGEMSSFSAAGPDVDLAAPGGSFDTRTDGGDRNLGVFSSITGGHYWWSSGTSMAAPQVAGAAALVLAAVPSASTQVVATCLKSTGPPLGGRSIYPTSSVAPADAPGPGGLHILDVPAAIDCAKNPPSCFQSLGPQRLAEPPSCADVLAALNALTLQGPQPVFDPAFNTGAATVPALLRYEGYVANTTNPFAGAALPTGAVSHILVDSGQTWFGTSPYTGAYPTAPDTTSVRPLFAPDSGVRYSTFVSMTVQICGPDLTNQATCATTVASRYLKLGEGPWAITIP